MKVPILIVLGDHDFVRLEHAIGAFKLIPNAEITVIPVPATPSYFRNKRE